MEEKEKQIEEMAKEIEKAKQKIWAGVRTRAEDEDYLWHSRAIAEHLMLQGYRKIPDGSVVLTREEYEKLCKEKNDYKQRSQSFEKRYEQLIQSSCEAITKARKGTAKEFASKVKECKEIKELVELGYIVSYVDLCKGIDEIAKQYGVEE